MGLPLLGAGHIGLELHEELVCWSESRGIGCNRRQWKLLSSLEILSLGLSWSRLDDCFDHIMVCIDYSWVHQLDIPEVMTQGRGGHDIISSGSKYSVDGSIRIVQFVIKRKVPSPPQLKNSQYNFYTTFYVK